MFSSFYPLSDGARGPGHHHPLPGDLIQVVIVDQAAEVTGAIVVKDVVRLAADAPHHLDAVVVEIIRHGRTIVAIAITTAVTEIAIVLVVQMIGVFQISV
jgi:hypothetical protein